MLPLRQQPEKVFCLLPSLFNSDDPLRSHFALRLASQEHFQKWVQTSVTDHDKRSRYLGYRCLLEAMEGLITNVIMFTVCLIFGKKTPICPDVEKFKLKISCERANVWKF